MSSEISDSLENYNTDSDMSSSSSRVLTMADFIRIRDDNSVDPEPVTEKDEEDVEGVIKFDDFQQDKMIVYPKKGQIARVTYKATVDNEVKMSQLVIRTPVISIFPIRLKGQQGMTKAGDKSLVNAVYKMDIKCASNSDFYSLVRSLDERILAMKRKHKWKGKYKSLLDSNGLGTLQIHTGNYKVTKMGTTIHDGDVISINNLNKEQNAVLFIEITNVWFFRGWFGPKIYARLIDIKE